MPVLPLSSCSFSPSWRVPRLLASAAAAALLLSMPSRAAPQPQAGGRLGSIEAPDQPDAAAPDAPGAADPGADHGGTADRGDGDQVGEDDASPRRPGAFGAYLGGQFALSTDNAADAADLLLRALRADPENQTLQQQTFLSCLLAGREEAVPLAFQLPGSSAALLLLGDTKAAAGDWGAAQQFYAALPLQPLTDVIRPLLVAWAQQGAGDTDAALATLAPLMRGAHVQGIYALHAAIIADQAGRDREAARLFEDAQNGFSGANLRLGQIMASFEARHGQEEEAHATIAAMVQQGPDLAIAEPAMLEAVARPVISTPAEGIAEAYLAMAATLRQQNADGFAEVLLRLAISLRPDFTAAKLLMSDILLAAHQGDEGLAMLRGVAKDDPLRAVVALRIAQFEGALDENEVAERTLQGLAAQYPRQPEPLEQLGALYMRQKRFADAVAAYDGAVSRLAHPDDPQAADWTLFFDRGVALDRAHEWLRAEADLKRALQMAPGQAVVMNYLGYSWADQNRNLDQARDLLQKAVLTKPDDGEIIDSLGWVMLRQGDVAGAVRRLERASELQPDDATINAHLGDAYWAAGRKREAADQWRRALVFKPEPEDIGAIQAKLKQADAQSDAPTRAVQPGVADAGPTAAVPGATAPAADGVGRGAAGVAPPAPGPAPAGAGAAVPGVVAPQGDGR